MLRLYKRYKIKISVSCLINKELTSIKYNTGSKVSYCNYQEFWQRDKLALIIFLKNRTKPQGAGIVY